MTSDIQELIEAMGGIEAVRRYVLSEFYIDFAGSWAKYGDEGIAIVARFDPELLAEMRDMLTPPMQIVTVH